MSSRKYNFVVFGSSWDLYLHSYSDIMYLSDVRYISESIRYNMMRRNSLYHLHLGNLNKYVQIPFKSIWNHCYFPNDFADNKPICFLFTGSWMRLNKFIHLTDYIKKTYPDSKTACFITDLVNTQRYPYTDEPLNIEEEKKSFDIMLSFDHKDCENYGFLYHPLVYSVIDENADSRPVSDIYFLGQAKNRMDEIIQIYEKLRQTNLKLDINLIGVPCEKQRYPDEIHYLDSFMTYYENLQHLLNSKCVLEIMQKNGHGFTQRCVEVVGENKKLLTNNPEVIEAPFYNADYISHFSSADDLDFGFINRISSDEIIDYNYKEKISPIELIDFIDSYL